MSVLSYAQDGGDGRSQGTGPPTGTRVTILPLPSQSTVPQLATVRTTVVDTVALTLQLTGKFHVTQARDGQWTSAEEYLAATELGTVDRIVTVQAELTNGEYTIATTVVNPVDGSIETRRTESVRSVLFLFDTVDLLVPDLLEEMVGRRITFGSVRVEVGGWDTAELQSLTVGGRPLTDLVPDETLGDVGGVDARVLIDGIPVGGIGETAERILTGRHRVTVEQRRGGDGGRPGETDGPTVTGSAGGGGEGTGGTQSGGAAGAPTAQNGAPTAQGGYVQIYDRTVTIEANRTETVAIEIPLLTEAEADQLRGALRAIDQVIERAQEAEVELSEIEAAVGEADEVVENLGSAAPPLASLQPALADLKTYGRVVALETRVARQWDQLDQTVLRELAALRSAVGGEPGEPGEQPGPFTSEAADRLAAIEQAYPQLWSLAIAAGLDTRSVASIRAAYQDLKTGLSRFDLDIPGWIQTDLAVLEAIAREHEDGFVERTGFYRLLGFGGAGLGLAGLAGLTGSYLLAQELADLKEQYDGSTDPTEASQLRTEIESRNALFNGLVYGGVGALSLGTGSIVAGQVVENRDQKRPDRLRTERLRTYFGPRAALADGYRDAVTGGETTLPVAGFQEAVSPAPEGLVMALPEEAADAQDATAREEVGGPGDDGAGLSDQQPDLPVVEYPWASVNVAGIVLTRQDGNHLDPSTVSELWSFGGSMYGIGAISTAVTLGIGVGRTDPYLTIQESGWEENEPDNEPKIGTTAALELGNRWRRLSVGVMQVFDGTLSPYHNVFLGFRRFSATVHPLGDGGYELMLDYRQPIGPDPRAARKRENDAQQAGSSVVRTAGTTNETVDGRTTTRYSVGALLPAGFLGSPVVPGIVPSWFADPTIDVGNGNTANLNTTFFPIGVEIAKRVWPRLSVGVGFELRIDTEGMSGISYSTPTGDGAAGHRSLFAGYVMGSYQFLDKLDWYVQSGSAVVDSPYSTWTDEEHVDDLFPPGGAGVVELWLETGATMPIALERTGLSVSVGPRWTMLNMTRYWDVWLHDTGIMVSLDWTPDAIATNDRQGTNNQMDDRTDEPQPEFSTQPPGDVSFQPMTIVRYPSFSANAVIGLQTASVQDLRTEFDVWTGGLAMYSYGAVPISLGVSAGVGRLDPINLERWPDRFDGIPARNDLDVGWIGTMELGNRWKSLAIGGGFAFEGMTQPAIIAYLAWRRVAGIVIPFGGGRMAAFVQYAHPLGADAAKARNTQKNANPEEPIGLSNPVRVRTFLGAVGNNGPQPDPELSGMYPVRRVESITFEPGIELVQPLNDKHEIGIGLFRVLGNPWNPLEIHFESDATVSPFGTFEAVDFGPALGVHGTYYFKPWPWFGLLARPGVRFLSPTTDDLTTVESLRLPERAAFADYFLEVGTRLEFGIFWNVELGVEAAYRANLMPMTDYWDYDSYIRYRELSFRVTVEPPQREVVPAGSIRKLLSKTAADEETMQSETSPKVGEEQEQALWSYPRFSADAQLAFYLNSRWNTLFTGMSVYAYEPFAFGVGLGAGYHWGGDDNGDLKGFPLFGQVVFGNRWDGVQFGVVGGAVFIDNGRVDYGGYPMVVYKQFSLGAIWMDGLVLGLGYSHPLGTATVTKGDGTERSENQTAPPTQEPGRFSLRIGKP